MKKLNYFYDETHDTITIEGICYAGAVFRELAFCSPGSKFKVESNNEGVLFLSRLP